jgi:hypothetical protein
MTSTEYQPEENYDEPDPRWGPKIFPRKSHKIFFSPEDEYNQLSDVLQKYCQQKRLTYTDRYLDSFYEWLLTADLCHTHSLHNSFYTDNAFYAGDNFYCGVFFVPIPLVKLLIKWAKCFSLDIQRDLRLLKFKKCLDYTCRKKQFTCDKDELFHNFIKWYDESPIYKNTYDEYPPHIPVAEYIYMIKNTTKTT